MFKDALGQDIGPGDVAYSLDGLRLVVLGWFTGHLVEVLWEDEDGVCDDVTSGAWLLRIGDYSDVDEGVAKDIQELEALYTTITGERYG